MKIVTFTIFFIILSVHFSSIHAQVSKGRSTNFMNGLHKSSFKRFLRTGCIKELGMAFEFVYFLKKFANLPLTNRFNRDQSNVFK